MIKPAYEDVQTWVFDLDNTLYPPSVRLFDQIELRMTDWVMQAIGVGRDRADYLRKHYWERYGTTLAGLMAEHDVDPAPYLTDVHDIDFSELQPDRALIDALHALPGRRIVYTNGCVPYAHNVLAARGLSDAFHAVYGVEDAEFLPKPDPAAFTKVFEKDGLTANRSIMFEDEPRNLLAPHAMGMATIHVAPTPVNGDHIDHHTDDLTTFLQATLQAMG